MPNTRTTLLCIAALALGSIAQAAFGAEIVDKNDLKLKNLKGLEERADSTADYEHLARLYGLRAEMLDEKIEHHMRLEHHYAAAPAVLLAKRGTAWNTPKRQRQLAWSAWKRAQQSRERSAACLAKARVERLAVQ